MLTKQQIGVFPVPSRPTVKEERKDMSRAGKDKVNDQAPREGCTLREERTHAFQPIAAIACLSHPLLGKLLIFSTLAFASTWLTLVGPGSFAAYLDACEW